jgi:GTP-binding protein
VVADIPGIIEGAHTGKGLGLRFLQHVERTRVLAFLIPLDQPDSQRVYDRLRHEIQEYSEALFQKPHVVLLSKRDLLPEGDRLPVLETPGALGILAFSSAARTGLDDLKEYLWKTVVEVKETASGGVEEAWP